MVTRAYSRLRRWAGFERAPAQDGRSKRIVVVIECILNQNARDPGAAESPAFNEAVVRLCAKHQAGIVQMPCPEKAYLGLQRGRPRGASIRQALDTPGGRQCCAQLGNRIADQLRDYVANGYRALAILGGNSGSAGCAVIADRAGLAATSGVLMQELDRALRERKMNIPFRGIRDADPDLEQEDLEWLRNTLQSSDSLVCRAGSRFAVEAT
jgi:predicted secreted protein